MPWSSGRWTSWAASISPTAPSSRCVTGVDDHSRFCVSARLMPRATARPVCEALVLPFATTGSRRQILTDNGKVFTGPIRPRHRPSALRPDLPDNGIRHLLTAPYSSTTTGKVERFHRTLRDEFLVEHDRRHATIEALQAALDSWVLHYNTLRPHQSVGMRPRSSASAWHEATSPSRTSSQMTKAVGRRGAPTRDHPPGRPGRPHSPGWLGLWRRPMAHRRGGRDHRGRRSRRDQPPRHPRRHPRPASSGEGHELLANEPRQRAARRPTTGPMVRRRVDSSGSVSSPASTTASATRTSEAKSRSRSSSTPSSSHSKVRSSNASPSATILEGVGAFARPLGKRRTHRCA